MLIHWSTFTAALLALILAFGVEHSRTNDDGQFRLFSLVYGGVLRGFREVQIEPPSFKPEHWLSERNAVLITYGAIGLLSLCSIAGAFSLLRTGYDVIGFSSIAISLGATAICSLLAAALLLVPVCIGGLHARRVAVR